MLAILVMLGLAAAQESGITLTRVDDAVPRKAEIVTAVGTPVAVEGTVRLPGGAARADYLVQLLNCRQPDDRCEVAATTQLEPGGGGGAGRASFSTATPLAGADEGMEFRLTALLVARRQRLRHGVIDRAAAMRVAVATTAPVVLRVDSRPATREPAIDGGCFIDVTSIGTVYGRPVKPVPGGEPLEVGLSTLVEGVVDKPSGAAVAVVVKPTLAEGLWVQPSKGLVAGRRWSETAWVGRAGLDTGETYRLQAVVTMEPIAAREYSPSEWRSVEARAVCATSAEALVRRRSSPGDLVIHSVAGSRTTEGDLPAPVEFRVDGGIEDPSPALAIREPETIWVLARPRNRKGWSVTALAIVLSDGLSWRVPAMSLPPGKFELMAVAVRRQLRLGEVLDETQFYQLVVRRQLTRMSIPAYVIVQEGPVESQ